MFYSFSCSSFISARDRFIMLGIDLGQTASLINSERSLSKTYYVIKLSNKWTPWEWWTCIITDRLRNSITTAYYSTCLNYTFMHPHVHSCTHMFLYAPKSQINDQTNINIFLLLHLIFSQKSCSPSFTTCENNVFIKCFWHA